MLHGERERRGVYSSILLILEGGINMQYERLSDEKLMTMYSVLKNLSSKLKFMGGVGMASLYEKDGDIYLTAISGHSSDVQWMVVRKKDFDKVLNEKVNSIKKLMLKAVQYLNVRVPLSVKKVSFSLDVSEYTDGIISKSLEEYGSYDIELR